MKIKKIKMKTQKLILDKIFLFKLIGGKILKQKFTPTNKRKNKISFSYY